MIGDAGKSEAHFEEILVWRLSKFTRKQEHAVALALALVCWISGLLGGMTVVEYGAVNEVVEVAVLLLGIAIFSLAPEIYWPTIW